MKIIITEDQYNELNEKTFRDFLYKFWDSEKKRGEEPTLDDIVYQIGSVKKHSKEDYQLIRPIWYEYNGGYDVLLKKIDEEFLNKEFHLEGGENLKMDFKINSIESYGEDLFGGMVDITCQILGGTVDGYVLNQDTEEMEMIPDMSLQDQLAEYEYDSGDFEYFLKEEISIFLEHKFEKYGVPIHIESFL